MKGTVFQKEVWAALEKIPRGKVTTYGVIAEFLKKPGAYRAVGTAVGKNPNAPKVPCHRVVKSDGSLGGYSGVGGIKKKVKLLKLEGVSITEGEVKDFERVMYNFAAADVSEEVIE